MEELKELFNKAAALTSNLMPEQKAKYNEYLDEHIANVKKGYEWMEKNLPEVVAFQNLYHFDMDAFYDRYYGKMKDIIDMHDLSKYRNYTNNAADYCDLKVEYDPYGEYFYGDKENADVKKRFNLAWLSHIHMNPHHWQHWILQHDDEGTECIDIPKVFMIEMICDWWSFSWKTGKLYEIFDWYDKHKAGIKMSSASKKYVEDVLSKIKAVLDSQKKD